MKLAFLDTYDLDLALDACLREGAIQEQFSSFKERTNGLSEFYGLGRCTLRCLFLVTQTNSSDYCSENLASRWK